MVLLQPRISITQIVSAAGCRRGLAFRKTDDPIPFSRSGARAFRVVDDTIMQGERELRRSRFAVPLGLLSFAALVYLGFFRKEGAGDSNPFLHPPTSEKPAADDHDQS